MSNGSPAHTLSPSTATIVVPTHTLEPSLATTAVEKEDANTLQDVEAQNDTQPKLTDQTNYLPRRKIVMVFLACASVDFLALMDQTNVAVALTAIGSDLGAGSQASWVASAYFLTSTCFQLLYGRFSDVWGRKFILLVGLGIFFVGTLASSVSATMLQLIIFRAFTGVGGGGLMSLCQVIVSDVVSLRERGKYQGILGAVVALANGVGPVIGGAFAATDWRWIFRMNLPICAVTTAMVWWIMPLKKVEGHWKEKLFRIDFVGAVLSLASTTLLILGLTWAGAQYTWDSTHVLCTLLIGVALAVAFCLWQWKGATLPIMPLYIFKSRMVNGACLTMSINGFCFLVQIFYLPNFYQLAYGYSAVKSGALLLPLVLVQTFMSTLSGLVVTWLGRYREIILLGWACWATGLGLLSTLNESSSLAKQIGYSIFTGFGVGMTLQASLVAIQAAVPRSDMAVVTSTRNFVRNLGGTLGLAIAGSILNNLLRSSLAAVGVSNAIIRAVQDDPGKARDMLDDATRAAVIAGYKRGFRAIFVTCSGLAGLAFFIALFLMPQISLDRKDDAQLKAESKAWLAQQKEAKRAKRGEAEAKNEAA